MSPKSHLAPTAHEAPWIVRRALHTHTHTPPPPTQHPLQAPPCCCPPASTPPPAPAPASHSVSANPVQFGRCAPPQVMRAIATRGQQGRDHRVGGWRREGGQGGATVTGTRGGTDAGGRGRDRGGCCWRDQGSDAMGRAGGGWANPFPFYCRLAQGGADGRPARPW